MKYEHGEARYRWLGIFGEIRLISGSLWQRANSFFYSGRLRSSNFKRKWRYECRIFNVSMHKVQIWSHYFKFDTQRALHSVGSPSSNLKLTKREPSLVSFSWCIEALNSIWPFFFAYDVLKRFYSSSRPNLTTSNLSLTSIVVFGIKFLVSFSDKSRSEVIFDLRTQIYSQVYLFIKAGEKN